MVTVRYFIWALGLRLWSVSEAVMLKLEFLAIFSKFYIRPPVSVSLYLMLFYVLYGPVLFRKGGFRSIQCL